MADEYGLFIGNHNNIQIDSRYRNLPVFYKGQASGIGTSGWQPLTSYEPENWQYDIEPEYKYRGWMHYTGLDDVAYAVAFKPGYSWHVSGRIGHGIYTPELNRIYQPHLLCEGPYDKTVAPDTVDYVVYSPQAYNSVATDQYGLVLRNANNEISYHSSLNHLKIREIKSFIPSNLWSYNTSGDVRVTLHPQTISHVTENPYYILPYIGMHINSCVKATPGGLDYWCYVRYVLGLRKVSATSCEVSFFEYHMSNYAFLHPSVTVSHVLNTPVSIAICTL
jgi:hypothetical protein